MAFDKNFDFAPISCLGLASKPYVPVKKTIVADDQNRIQNEFVQMQTALPKHEQTIVAWQQNVSLNRYADMRCFDQTRVVLKDGLTPDYIHANFVTGYQRNNAYILTQGPMDNTVVDFWRMVWQENVITIVMVTHLEENGRQKCARYFPFSNDVDFQAGIFKISLKLIDRRKQCLSSVLSVTNVLTNVSRICVHIWYICWPDKGVPENDEMIRLFSNYIKLANVNFANKFYHIPDQHMRGPPIIFHCSAGVGRSAVLVAMDILLEALNHSDFIDCHQLVLKMRRERYHTIHTKIQLLFLCDFLANASQHHCYR